MYNNLYKRPAIYLLLIFLVTACRDNMPISSEELIADFEIRTAMVNSNTDINILDSSTGNITRREWTFSGANISESDVQSPIIQFTRTGDVEIQLIVFDDAQDISDTLSRCYNVFPGDGLVAYFPLDGQARDFSGNNFNGIVNGTEMYADVNGNENSARVFHGKSDYITSSPDIDNLLSNGATFSAWVKPLDTIDIGTIVSNLSYEGSSLVGFEFSYGTYDYRGVGLSYASSSDDKIFWRSEDLQQMQLNEWSHVLATWNGEVDHESSEIGIYIDSQYANSNGGARHPNNNDTFSDSDDPLIIGSKYLRNNFHCAIDEVRIYDRVLSSEEIQLLQAYKQ